MSVPRRFIARQREGCMCLFCFGLFPTFCKYLSFVIELNFPLPPLLPLPLPSRCVHETAIHNWVGRLTRNSTGAYKVISLTNSVVQFNRQDMWQALNTNTRLIFYLLLRAHIHTQTQKGPLKRSKKEWTVIFQLLFGALRSYGTDASLRFSTNPTFQVRFPNIKNNYTMSIYSGSFVRFNFHCIQPLVQWW